MRLATADWKDSFEDEYSLSPDNPFENQRKLDAVRGRQAIRELNNPDAVAAAGGWCAPSTIRYDVGTMGTEERPVRDNLTTFGATRGGIRYFVDLSIAATDTTDGITHLTETQDEGGTTTKDCVVIECPTDSEVRADVIASCLQAGNLAMIAFPELIEAWQNLLAVATARHADSALLDAIADDDQTIEVTSDAVYGSFHSVARAFLKVAAGYRSRHRLGNTDPLMALAPAWLADNVVLDLVGRQFPWPQEVSRNGVAALIERLTGVRVGDGRGSDLRRTVGRGSARLPAHRSRLRVPARRDPARRPGSAEHRPDPRLGAHRDERRPLLLGVLRGGSGRRGRGVQGRDHPLPERRSPGSDHGSHLRGGELRV